MVRIFYSFLFLVTLFFVSRFVFEPTNLYFEIKWLDIPMHIFGGIGIAALSSAIFAYKGKKATIASTVAVYLIVAVCWETYEFARGVMVYRDTSDYIDTVSDVVNGLIGVFLAKLLSLSSKEKK